MAETARASRHPTPLSPEASPPDASTHVPARYTTLAEVDAHFIPPATRGPAWRQWCFERGRAVRPPSRAPEWFAKLDRPLQEDTLLHQFLTKTTRSHGELALPGESRKRRLIRTLVDDYDEPELLLLRWGALASPGPADMRPSAANALTLIASSRKSRWLTRQAVFLLWGCCPAIGNRPENVAARPSPARDVAWFGALAEAVIEVGLPGLPIPWFPSALQAIRKIGRSRKQPCSRLVAAILGTEFNCDDRRALRALCRPGISHRQIYEDARLVAPFYR